MRLRLGMVGGGPNAFFGAVHRAAARLGGSFDLVAGAFSADPAQSRQSGALLDDPLRAYDSWAEMAARESARPDRPDLVTIVTPNHLHFPIADAFLQAGFHVLCEKPMVTSSAEATLLSQRVQQTKCVFAVAHTYSGYPMVRQARQMVRGGVLGELRLVHVEYLQDWLAAKTEGLAGKQAEWRDDPKRAGPAGAVGDIGSHAYNLLCLVTGTTPVSLAADLHRLGEGRMLDDNAHILLRLPGAARGLITLSQVTPGAHNGLRLRVTGSAGSLDWAQETPDLLLHTPLGEPTRQWARGMAGLAAPHTGLQLPPGHPQGYVEALSTIYDELGSAIRAHGLGQHWEAPIGTGLSYGVAGMAFIEAAIDSDRNNTAWTTPR